MLIARTTDRSDIFQAEELFDKLKIPYDTTQVGNKWFINTDQPQKAIKALMDAGLVKKQNPILETVGATLAAGLLHSAIISNPVKPECPHCLTSKYFSTHYDGNKNITGYTCEKCGYKTKLKQNSNPINPNMKIKSEHYNELKEKINEFFDKNPEIKATDSLNYMRHRWDVFHSIGSNKYLGSEEKALTHRKFINSIYEYANDDNIDTALKYILKERLSKSNPVNPKLVWKKIPSVSPGGAAYFYITFLGKNGYTDKRIVVFNRDTKKWDIEGDDTYIPEKGYTHVTYGRGFSTALQAMKHFENNVKNPILETIIGGLVSGAGLAAGFVGTKKLLGADKKNPLANWRAYFTINSQSNSLHVDVYGKDKYDARSNAEKEIRDVWYGQNAQIQSIEKIKKSFSNPARLFKDLAIGETFKNESYGMGFHKTTLSGMEYEKINKSKAKVIRVWGNYRQDYVGGIYSFGPYHIIPSKNNPVDPWKSKVRLTPEQRKAKQAYEFALKQEDRFAGSVFANSFSIKQYETKTKEAYERCKRLGMGVEHGMNPLFNIASKQYQRIPKEFITNIVV